MGGIGVLGLTFPQLVIGHVTRPQTPLPWLHTDGPSLTKRSHSRDKDPEVSFASELSTWWFAVISRGIYVTT